jgi:single-strand DNA-binding protein
MELKQPQINECTISGRLASEVKDVQYSPSGSAYTSFRMASDDGFGDRKSTSFWTVKAFGKCAERCGSDSAMVKGSPVVVHGRAVIDEWQTSAGEKRTTPTIKASSVSCLVWPDDLQQGTFGQQMEPPEEDMPF